jgi:hypothetical protein
VNKKEMTIISAVCILFTLITYVGIKVIIAGMNEELKAPKVIKITNEYLTQMYPEEKCKIIDGPNWSLAIGRYGLKIMNQDNLSFSITIAENLKFLEDSRTEEHLNNEINTFLKNKYKSKFKSVKGNILANVVINDKYLDRKDTVYIDIIDSGDITKQEFASIAVQTLDWINSNGYYLNILYVDYMHKENSDYVYSIKVDSSNNTKKDLIPYIRNMG